MLASLNIKLAILLSLVYGFISIITSQSFSKPLVRDWLPTIFRSKPSSLLSNWRFSFPPSLFKLYYMLFKEYTNFYTIFRSTIQINCMHLYYSPVILKQPLNMSRSIDCQETMKLALNSTNKILLWFFLELPSGNLSPLYSSSCTHFLQLKKIAMNGTRS